MSALELGKYVHRGLAHKRVVLIQCQSWAAVLCEVAEIRYWQTDIQTKYCNHRCACVCVCVCVHAECWNWSHGGGAKPLPLCTTDPSLETYWLATIYIVTTRTVRLATTPIATISILEWLPFLASSLTVCITFHTPSEHLDTYIPSPLWIYYYWWEGYTVQ